MKVDQEFHRLLWESGHGKTEWTVAPDGGGGVERVGPRARGAQRWLVMDAEVPLAWCSWPGVRGGCGKPHSRLNAVLNDAGSCRLTGAHPQDGREDPGGVREGGQDCGVALCEGGSPWWSLP